ncbi:hypothetical protein BST61_g759 [Cercospora zeina]
MRTLVKELHKETFSHIRDDHNPGTPLQAAALAIERAKDYRTWIFSREIYGYKIIQITPPSSSSESSSLSQRPPSTPSPIDRQTLSEPISWSKWEGFLVWRQDLGRQVQPPYTSGGRWSEFPDVGVPTSKGLNNRANDCYRSAVLQALFHVPAFYRYMATIHRIYATSFAIMHAPEVLFLQFGRFDNFARKISTEISYPEILDLNMHREPGVVNEECIYRLDAVVAHKGSNIGGGHYVAAVRKHHEEGFEVIDDAYEIASSRGGGFQEMLRPTSQGWGGQAFILMYKRDESLRMATINPTSAAAAAAAPVANAESALPHSIREARKQFQRPYASAKLQPHSVPWGKYATHFTRTARFYVPAAICMFGWPFAMKYAIDSYNGVYDAPAKKGRRS